MNEDWMKVGALAKRTSLTVRTLHHWDEIGLLTPGRRTSSGHRLYGPAQVRRLQHIVALRALGFGLEDIRSLVDDPDQDLHGAVSNLIREVETELERQRKLRERLLRVREMIENETYDAGAFLEAIRETVDMEKYYTKEQLEQLRQRRDALGEDGMLRAQREWAELYAALGTHRDQGLPPDDPALDRWVVKFHELIRAFTGGDAGIARSHRRVYEEEGPRKASRGMVDPEVHAYLQLAIAARE